MTSRILNIINIHYFYADRIACILTLEAHFKTLSANTFTSTIENTEPHIQKPNNFNIFLMSIDSNKRNH